MATINNGGYAVDIKMTMADGIGRWLYQVKQKAIKRGSFVRLETSYKMLLRYGISAVRLMDLQTADVQAFVNKLADDGYALTTVKKQYNLISAYLRYLIGEGVPVRAAYVNVQLPSQSQIARPKKNIEAYTKVEQKRLMDVCAYTDNDGSRAIVLLIETGMRIGELLALSWEDVQWERKAVRIHRTLVCHHSRKDQLLQEGAKSESSNRTIPLSGKALQVLSRMYDDCDGEGLIFQAAHLPGESIGYATLRTQIRAICEAANVKYSGMHIFRHTFATNCYYKGCSVKVLSRFLGHSSVSITYNTYIHLYGDALEEMRSIVN